MLKKVKLHNKQKELVKQQLDKDVARIENLIKQNDNEGNRHKKKIERQLRETHEENQKQEHIGLISKPKKIGRFKYR